VGKPNEILRNNERVNGFDVVSDVEFKGGGLRGPFKKTGQELT